MPGGRGTRTMAHEVLLKRVVCWGLCFCGVVGQYHKQNVFMMFFKFIFLIQSIFNNLRLSNEMLVLNLMQATSV